ncbi:Periplasmic thiol:disulfide oxidoreductase DsbB required for DsbA reoxidation [Paramagnetospirillum magnetotacticum MS-1]|uniref:Periplasmic thiol:disulfide oxidoreductase DsbB required for DsbA reoxidation n=1 Tax=Paramagnetospirillum magnetotacticum MS-1 TaxID=272627 RepID=A0A0C2YYN5_PARME|nr:disulfide bond formation protein B [Paramagnetospirillum magnetotacticum]KIM00194.1 Periplasmic thiol:disulfide oxidoreductase DsbB required for DsbA reoxidation [Paramagnetospirillum magnetotacticum MS-1]
MNITTRSIALSVAATCLAALAFALVAQYGFGLRPCNLCLIQRVPFVLAALLGLAALKADPPASLLLRIAGLLLLINGGIAIYHVGVEQHWWASAVCSGAQGGDIAVADLMAEMSRPAEAQCDTPAWSFHGITMAVLNVPFSALFGLGVLWAVKRSEASS